MLPSLKQNFLIDAANISMWFSCLGLGKELLGSQQTRKRRSLRHGSLCENQGRGWPMAAWTSASSWDRHCSRIQDIGDTYTSKSCDNHSCQVNRLHTAQENASVFEGCGEISWDGFLASAHSSSMQQCTGSLAPFWDKQPYSQLIWRRHTLCWISWDLPMLFGAHRSST